MMTRFRYPWIALLLMASATWAKVDLVTLPPREAVQLTIYNSADLTLARESRALTLKEGANALQFSWANTLIDPTSLEMLPKANADRIDIAELVYPPGVTGLGLWNISSEVSGKVPVEISYLTSGLSWRAFYMGTLSADEKTMRLQGYVRVTNNSGEDYENAQVRVIVGKVHLLDEIAELARRQYPYGRPVGPLIEERSDKDLGLKEEMEKSVLAFDLVGVMPMEGPMKQIIKEGLSEYFLYTIEGTETIPNGWSKRLLSFDVDAVPVVSLYKYEEDRYGPKAVRFLSFTNDTEHKLGQTPIPDGTLKVYRGVDDAKHLSYEGQSSFKYIPVGDEVELNLGAVEDVVIEPKMMEYRTENYRFDRNGNVAGWDEIRTFAVTVKNTRSIPVKVEIRRNFDTTYWTLTRTGDVDEFEKVDVDTVEFTLLLPAGSQKRFEYTLTTYQGTRREDWSRIAR
ncbi:MAG TPA: DUF4139 domain-containing protein [Sedimentisphaerales bacterium]|nr:DUF4139 domain-containing protein [Sedimentisphaerales bacterium]HRS10700.1 DUF4139 domain-containing protein [Sedimentisphaerales bacterium]HRV47405.1 DUF4139 domain-containing protein [Sedimentisphaerales bacterium]